MNWDDLKFFLAVARKVSIRKASSELQVNHTTVSRRINQLEADFGVRLFERLPSGYECTPAGEDMRKEAEALEDKVFQMERRLMGKDAELSGWLRVTMHDMLTHKLLMPQIAEFCRVYPNIDLELISSYDTLNLGRREADVAVRITNDPPEDLVGRKLGTYKVACYVAKDIADQYNDQEIQQMLPWLGWDDEIRKPDWVNESPLPQPESRHRFANPLVQLEACKRGMGISMLPCFLGDEEAGVVRIADGWSRPAYDVWVLTHPDLRHTQRVREFMTWMKDTFIRLENRL